MSNPEPVGAAGERTAGGRVTAVAATWHTVALLIILAGWAYRGVLRAEHLRALGNTHRLSGYAQTIAMEWLLLGFVLLGVRLQGSSYAAALGKRWESARAIWDDIKFALLFWIGSTIVLMVVGLLLHAHENNQMVNFLLPQSAIERAVWMLVAISAGICEEAVFRGYLQHQFMAMTQSAPVAIGLSALAFAGVHAYQGWRLMISIGVLGVMLGVLAHWRGTVRTE